MIFLDTILHVTAFGKYKIDRHGVPECSSLSCLPGFAHVVPSPNMIFLVSLEIPFLSHPSRHNSNSTSVGKSFPDNTVSQSFLLSLKSTLFTKIPSFPLVNHVLFDFNDF